MATVQAHGTPADDICEVQLNVVDAIAVAQSIRTLVRGRKLPPGTAEIYNRVADQILASAQLKLSQRGAR